ncbi:MAG: hypothetical protein NTX45_28565 [Proteobacteria bacterium]|nr:hypothetical protein [Pseudomonadota bacterium]
MVSISAYADYPARKCGSYPGLSDDPFRRCIVFKNELPFTVWPVLEAPLDANGMKGSKQVSELFISKGAKNQGVQPGEEVKLYVPKNGESEHGWYKAARIYVFSTEPTKLMAATKDPSRVIQAEAQPKQDPCPESPGSCWAGRMNVSFMNDAPLQLLEFTAMSKDWSGTNADGEWPDRDDPRGVPFIDYDVSYVDHIYLPAAITLDDGGATRHTGTTLDFATFKKSVDGFLNYPAAGWQAYAAYSAKFWNDHNLIVKMNGPNEQRVPSASMLVDGVLVGDLSSLYVPWVDPDPKDPNATSCKSPKWPSCNNLSGSCCPAPSSTPGGDPMFLDCCGLGKQFMVNGTGEVDGKYWNKSLDAIWARWDKWLNGKPCADLSTINPWPSDKPQFDKQGFCDQFQQSVKYLWSVFSNSKDVQAVCSKFQGDTQSYDYCMMSYVIGYKVPKDDKQLGRQPETVQGLMRNLPWGDGVTQKQYHWDKFLHYWAPPGSVFNLNPYVYLVKHKDTDNPPGIGAKSGYSFSIDDQWSNYQDMASGIIVNLGGSSDLLNLDSFDPYEQFVLTLSEGWDHGTICGRPVKVIDKKGMAFTFSFWQNAIHQDHCDIVMYPNTGNDSHVSFRLLEYTDNVVDNWTGLAHPVKGFKAQDGFCAQNSSADQVLLCDPAQTKIEPKRPSDAKGGLEVVYVSVDEAKRPNVAMIFRPPAGR